MLHVYVVGRSVVDFV